MSEPEVVYRRRYTCPHCGNKGRCNYPRHIEERPCAYCGKPYLAQVQNESGVYDEPCRMPLDSIEYHI